MFEGGCSACASIHSIRFTYIGFFASFAHTHTLPNAAELRTRNIRTTQNNRVHFLPQIPHRTYRHRDTIKMGACWLVAVVVLMLCAEHIAE